MPNTFKRLLSRSVGTGATSIGTYTSPAGANTTVVGLTVSNITSGDITISVTLNDGANDTHIAKDSLLATGETFVLVGGDQKVVLQEGDSIKLSSNTAASADAIMSLLELT